MTYRSCVGLMVANPENMIFTGKRRLSEDVPGRYAWQMPQGGIDEGETAEQAAMRELYEETGITSAVIIAKSPHTIRYDIPDHVRRGLWQGRYRGQEQTWFLLRFTGEDREIDITGIHQEFTDWRWTPVTELADMVVPFKRKVYEEVIRIFSPLLG